MADGRGDSPVGLNPVEDRVLRSLDREGMVAFAQELVRIPSLGGQEDEAQELVGRQLQDMGLEVDVWDLDMATLKEHPAYCAEIDRAAGLGVVGMLGEELGGRSLILNGHVDVVPPGDLANWSVPPWEGRVQGGELHGRGSLDMKAGLACALFAAKAIRDAGVVLKGRLVLESVIGEPSCEGIVPMAPSSSSPRAWPCARLRRAC